MTFDLIFVDNRGAKTLAAALPDKMIGPFPFKGAGVPIVAALLAEPGCTLSKSDLELAFTYVHFRNMAAKKNSAGQDYPFVIGEG